MSVSPESTTAELFAETDRRLRSEVDTALIRVSRPWLDRSREWSEPVQVRAVENDDGSFELEVREP